MKKLNILTIALVVISISSCRHHRHVTIATHSNNYNVKLEYEGSIAVSTDRTKIERISKGGYVDFKRNNDELYASPDKAGHVHYEMNGTEISKLDDAAQSMLDEAITMIIKSSH